VASTVVGRRLTEAHRLAQARIGARTVKQLLAVWPLLDPADIDGTITRWLQGVQPVVGFHRQQSTQLSANYLTTFRTLELGAGVPAFAPVLADALPVEQLATSMLVTGPVSLRSNLAKGMQFEKAVEVAQANSARAGMRHALNGGRETITGTVGADGRAKGWARATSGKSCSFCAMLASRGPVYAKGTVGFDAHDGCSCTAEPVYKDAPRSQWPPGSARYRDLYDETAKGLSSSDARAAFRRALAAGG
jgi:hypothetical protein